MSDAPTPRFCKDEIGLALRDAVDRRLVPGVAIGVSDRDKTVYSVAFGAGQRRSGIALDSHSVFRTASMTKLVTSIAALMLVDEGRVALDAPLAAYLPGYEQPGVLDQFEPRSGTYVTRPAAEPVTIKHLLTHTSGYGYWFLDSRLMRLTDADHPELYDVPFLIADPGTAFHYGTSTDVLGQMIETVGGVPLGEFFARRICKPLGMRDTSFSPPVSRHRLSSIYVRTEQGFEELPLESSGPPPRGGGGLYSTVEDYLKLLRTLLGGGEHLGQRLLSPDACSALTSNQIGALRATPPTSAMRARSHDFAFMDGTQRFGLGVAIETQDQPSGRRAGSYGWAGILNTYFWVDPSFELAAAIFMQVRPFADPDCIAVLRRFERVLYDCLEER